MKNRSTKFSTNVGALFSQVCWTRMRILLSLPSKSKASTSIGSFRRNGLIQFDTIELSIKNPNMMLNRLYLGCFTKNGIFRPFRYISGFPVSYLGCLR